MALPLAGFAVTHALFPVDRSLFSPLLGLAIVCAATFGGISSGVVATAISLLLNILAFGPTGPWQIPGPKNTLNGFAFVFAGMLVSFVAGSVGALNRKVALERRRLEDTLSCIDDAVISTDLNGRILLINASAEEATGWSSAEATGRNSDDVFQIVNESTRLTVTSPIRQALDAGQAVGLAMQTVLLRRDGSQIPVSDSAAPVRDSEGNIIGAVMVFRDISAHREREATWLQTQRLATVGRLAATIAHELNNPLQSTSNLLFLISEGGDSETLQAHAVEAMRELQRASDIANQTLSFVRSSGERSSVSVSQLFDEVLSLNRNKLKNKNIDVVRNYSPETVVTARTGEIRQVLGNVVGNALDALDTHGKLYLRARPAECLGRPVIQFIVADNGSGISKEHQTKVFEPFFTTKNDVGTGLGLWVVKKIIDSEGGCVRMRSKVGRGTVTRLCWPIRFEHDTNQMALGQSTTNAISRS
ncbi:PAS domain S-box protein [Telmatobacter sp. DSM 110680]|uniref:histidine kinase n=1 Tax=Telmatobacter sp. DSM 110680 TaxID=3036704 RepID=A0AAU7DHG5_9BACT